MMNNLVTYFAEVSVGLALFLVIYRMFLHRETFFRTNRLFLIVAVILALVIPALHVQFTIKMSHDQGAAFERTVGNTQIVKRTIDGWTLPIPAVPLAPESRSAGWSWIGIIYLTGMFIAFARLMNHISRILSIAARSERRRSSRFVLVKMSDAEAPFSFLKFIFVNRSRLSGPAFQQILAHEAVHANQWHALDLIFIELVSVFLWFNPLIYLYRKYLVEVHEYLADQGAILSGQDKIGYQKTLLQQTVQNQKILLASGYNQSMIKKRLQMIAKKKSNLSAQWKYILALPVVGLLVVNFAVGVKAQFFGGSTTKSGSDIVTAEHTEFVLLPPLNAEDIKGVTSDYGDRLNPITSKKEFHTGVDIAAREGAPVYAAADGQVVKMGKEKELGKFIYLLHAHNYMTGYGRLSAFVGEKDQKEPLLKGATVKQGQLIGYVGSTGSSTGPHLHYEMIKNGEHQNPEVKYAAQTYATFEGGDPVKKPDTWPKLIGGEEAVIKYIQENDLYPDKAKQAAMEGVVLLKFVVDAKGIPGDFTIVKEEPGKYGFAKVAEEAVRHMTFEPGTKDGEPVAVKTKLKVEFKLE